MPRPHRLTALVVAFAASLAMADAVAAAPAPAPSLAGPRETVAGRVLLLTATTTLTGQACELISTSPGGALRRTAVAGLRPVGTALRGRTIAAAVPGPWTLQLRCGDRASAALSMRVLPGRKPGRRPRLLGEVEVVRFNARRPTGWRAPAADQDASGAPRFDASLLDGLGASTGERASRALQWALKQVGRSDYALWCLRFTANAYNAPTAGYPSAQAAANALDLRGRGGSPASAPAGALVFFYVTGSGGESFGHVGLSLGDGRMVSAQATVRIERIRDVPIWRDNYLGWALPPAAWPGFPPPAPSAGTRPTALVVPAEALPAGSEPPSVAPTAAPPAPPSTTRIPLTVDNRNTNGLVMVEDHLPLRLQTRPWAFCYSRGCVVPSQVHPGHFSGGVFNAAVCQARGDTMTNGSYGDPADDANPDLYTSNLWYGVELSDGTFGYLPEVWIAAADRGGLGLPTCAPYPGQAPEAPVLDASATKLVIAVDNRVTAGLTMIEDSAPSRLTTRPWNGCSRRGCDVPLATDPGRFSGQAWDGAVCWTHGDEVTNGSASDPSDDANAELVTTRRWYGIQLADGTFGYVSEAWIKAGFRGGLGLPYCPPYPDAAP